MGAGRVTRPAVSSRPARLAPTPYSEKDLIMFVSEDQATGRAARLARVVSKGRQLGYGRFLQADPLGYDDGLNWYNYVGGDPVNLIDPTGTSCVQSSNHDGYATTGSDGTITYHSQTYSEVCFNEGGGGGGGPTPGGGGGGGDPAPQKDIVVVAPRCLAGTGNINGDPIHVPPGHSLSEFAKYGEAARGSISAYTNLSNFQRGGPWDTQRIGGQFHMEYRDFANVAIGTYGAAAGLSRDTLLTVSNAVAKFGHYNEPMSRLYPSTPQANVYNELLGYSLYQKGNLKVSACPAK